MHIRLILWIWEIASNLLLGAFAACSIMGCGNPGSNNGRQVVAFGSVNQGCYINASANDQVFSMLLDTGATGNHSLTFGRNHIKKLGLDASKLKFDHTYRSANGDGKLASITLREFRFESFVLHNVPVSIVQATLSEPLVGIDVLHQLNLRLSGGQCILTVPNTEWLQSSLTK